MELNDLKRLKIGFIGGGNMAKAIGVGLIRDGYLDVNKVWVSARTEATLKFWKDLGVHTTYKNGEVVDNCDIIFLAVKPNVLKMAVDDIITTVTKPVDSKVYVSVLVGVTLHTLHKHLIKVDSHPRIVRCLPNTLLMVGEGITVYCSLDVPRQDLDLLDILFGQIGMVESVPEYLMNAVGGLSGSGPAYAYLIIEALSDGATKMGVPRALATRLAAKVLMGAGKMVLNTDKHPGQLKDEVCSPGGTTITGVHEMERGQVRASMMNAVEAAVRRSNEIGQE